MNTSLKTFALVLGLALAGGTIAEAATPVADQTIVTHQVQTPKQTVKHAKFAAALRKHRLHIAHLRHLRKLHESRVNAHQGLAKVAKITKVSKAAQEVKPVKVGKTVLAKHAPANANAVVR